MRKSRLAIAFTGIVSIIFFYCANRICSLTLSFQDWRIQDLLYSITNFHNEPFHLSNALYPMAFGLSSAAGCWLVPLYNLYTTKTNFEGKEYGSAKWGTARDIKAFMDPDPFKNIILTSTESKSITENRPRNNIDDFNRNNNVLCVGGSGTGKSRFVIKPQLMQMYGSYVVTDPKGAIFKDCAKMLQDNGYEIKVFDLVDRENSSKYNPLAYINSSDDILKLINNLIKNTNSKDSKTEGDFWEKAETALLEALISYVTTQNPKELHTFDMVMSMLRKASVADEPSMLDRIFEDLAKRQPNHFAVNQYAIYKHAAGETAKSILISVGVRLSAFNIESVRELTSADEIRLESIGDKKTALFIILSDTDQSFNFLAAMLYQQLFDTLIYRADRTYKGRLPVPVMCLLDEFSNIGQIPNFHILIATIRSRGLGALLCLQGLSQLKSLYKDDWETIAGNCDSFLYLGGMEESTLKYVSEICGKVTISNTTYNMTKGQNSSFTQNEQRLGRDLVTFDEVATMKGRQCILKISRCNPFFSMKYQIEKHQNYKLLADFDSKNQFSYKDIKK